MSGQQEQIERVTGDVLPPEGDVAVAYDADAKSRDRARQAIRIDGVLYYPRRKTGRLVQQILEMAAEESDASKKKPEDRTSDENIQVQVEGMQMLYRQCAALIKDGEGNSPRWERLYGEDGEDGLDMDLATEIVGRVMNPEGNDDGGETSPNS